MFIRRALCSAAAAVLIIAGACGSDDDTGFTTSEVPEIADSDRQPPADD